MSNLLLADGLPQSPQPLGRIETKKERLMISPHPKAPRFAAESNPRLVLRQLYDEAMGGNFPTTEDFREWLRQAGLVSLWFYLKFVAAFSGPYESLNADLHVDMCNFFQRVDYGGSKAAAFIGRKHFKSTVFTHGGRGWTILRRPNVTIGIASNVYDRAQEFMVDIKNTFESNELFKWLYPEHAVWTPNNQPLWNAREITTPARTRFRDLPTVKPFTAIGSTQSLHFDILHIDDVVGDQQLTAMRQSAIEMVRIRNWFTSSIRTLVADWIRAQIFVVGTRYAEDDVYEYILERVKSRYGYWQGLDYTPSEHGEWDVYYRMALEDHGEGEQVIFPQRITKEGLERLAADDWWTYATQYMNNPAKAGLAEFAEYDVWECQLDWDEREGWLLSFSVGQRSGEGAFVAYEIPLWACDVVIGVDPGASEKGNSARVSESAIVVLATGPDGKRFVIDGFSATTRHTRFLDELFRLSGRYGGLVRGVGFEMMGAFKLYNSILREEEKRRGRHLRFRPVKAYGDKDARIRTRVQEVLEDKELYCVRSFYPKLMSNIKVFPDGHRKDVLDALSIAIEMSQIPRRQEDIDEEEEEHQLLQATRNRVTGY